MSSAGTVAMLALMALLAGGCAEPGPALNEAAMPCTAAAATRIEADTSKFLQGRFGQLESDTPDIVRYADAAALRQALGFSPSDRTSGYYDRAADRIHVACSGKPGFAALLMHEATHRYLYRRFAFRPGTDRFSAGEALPAVPPWLQEGLSSWMESAKITESGLELRINAARLAEFRQLLWRGRLPPLERVLATGFDEPFRSPDYAVSWALIWYLMQDAQGREGVAAYLEAARLGFFDEPEREYPAMVAACDEFSCFMRVWDEHVSAASARLFRTFLQTQGQMPDEWELAWRRAIWAIVPDGRP